MFSIIQGISCLNKLPQLYLFGYIHILTSSLMSCHICNLETSLFYLITTTSINIKHFLSFCLITPVTEFLKQCHHFGIKSPNYTFVIKKICHHDTFDIPGSLLKNILFDIMTTLNTNCNYKRVFC